MIKAVIEHEVVTVDFDVITIVMFNQQKLPKLNVQVLIFTTETVATL